MCLDNTTFLHLQHCDCDSDKQGQGVTRAGDLSPKLPPPPRLGAVWITNSHKQNCVDKEHPSNIVHITTPPPPPPPPGMLSHTESTSCAHNTAACKMRAYMKTVFPAVGLQPDLWTNEGTTTSEDVLYSTLSASLRRNHDKTGMSIRF